MFKVTEEQYFYVIYTALQQRLAGKCEVKLVGHAPFSMDEIGFGGIEISYKGICFHFGYQDVIMELKRYEDTTFKAMMVNIIQKIKREIAKQFVKDFEL